MVPTLTHLQGYACAEVVSGKGLTITMATSAIALGGLILIGQFSTNRAIDGLRTEMLEVRSDIADLRERMARLEGREDALIEVMVEQNSQ